MTTPPVPDLDPQHFYHHSTGHLRDIRESSRAAAREAKKRAVAMSVTNAMTHFSGHQYHTIVREHTAAPLPFGVFRLVPWETSLTPADVSEHWFDGIEKDATVAGNPVPPQSVIDEAKRIVRGMDQRLMYDCDVYSLEEGKIAIEIFGAPGNGLLLVCEPGGSALCIVTELGVSRRARYESSSILPDGFLKEGLAAVRSGF